MNAVGATEQTGRGGPALSETFSGFPEEGVEFLLELKRNNNRQWFEANRESFDTFLMQPARSLVVSLGDRLREIAPRVTADPRTNKSIFRIFRDTRFSKDKSPYKTHLGLFCWEGARPKMECPGFYFHLEPPELLLGVGLYMFPKDLIDPYRASVVDPKHGEQLLRALDPILSEKDYALGGKHYKRVPSGSDKDHPSAEYLLYNGLFGGYTVPIPRAIHTSDLPDFCMEHYRRMLPLHRWLVDLAERA